MKRLCFALLALAVVGCGPTSTTDSNAVAMSDEQLSTATGCDPTACGVKPAIATQICGDASTGGFTGQCIRLAGAAACTWEIRKCPTTTPPSTGCDSAACGPAPLVCNGGKAVCTVTAPDASPTGSTTGSVACHWSVVGCDPTTLPTPKTCDPSACGAAPSVCAEGKAICESAANAAGTTSCRWVVAGCDPTPACQPSMCGPQPTLCQGGKASCLPEPNVTGSALKCRWEVTGCTPTPITCDGSNCGPAPDVVCAGGTPPTCEPASSTTGAPSCHWVTHCPPANTCDPTKCGAPPPTCAGGTATCEPGASTDPTAGCHWVVSGCTPPPVTCGAKTCATGEVCCSESCGICGKANGACPAIACPPPTTCSTTDCGPKPATPVVTCWDGSTGGNVGQCERDSTTNACHWLIRSCPPAPTECATTDCGPKPSITSVACSDGSVGGLTGRCIGQGTAVGCHWEVRACP